MGSSRLPTARYRINNRDCDYRLLGVALPQPNEGRDRNHGLRRPRGGGAEIQTGAVWAGFIRRVYRAALMRAARVDACSCLVVRLLFRCYAGNAFSLRLCGDENTEFIARLIRQQLLRMLSVA